VGTVLVCVSVRKRVCLSPAIFGIFQRVGAEAYGKQTAKKKQLSAREKRSMQVSRKGKREVGIRGRREKIVENSGTHDIVKALRIKRFACTRTKNFKKMHRREISKL